MNHTSFDSGTTGASVLRLDPSDNVAVALRDIDLDADLSEYGLTCIEPIPSGHKIALVAIPKGTEILKYGQFMGIASADIPAGAHVHLHNVAMPDEGTHAAAAAKETRHRETAPGLPRTFEGFVRPDGKVGTRNYIGVIAASNCAASVVHGICERLKGETADFPNVDGVVPLSHAEGCGSVNRVEGFPITMRTLAGLLKHPNFASVVLVGLGCETAQIDLVFEAAGLEESSRHRKLSIQECGGTKGTIAKGIEIVRAMLPLANTFTRQTVDAAHLTVAVQCGGSDAYSGITANPALGNAVDRLVDIGGSAILSETSEIYGAEHLLLGRVRDESVARKLEKVMAWWDDYLSRNHGEMNNNPSPGNKKGGLTTILEKSLGAVMKGGTTTLNDVISYGEPVTGSGFVFMDGPGYDPACITGQMASGANVVCFTTGRGSAFGSFPAPTIKLVSNSATYRRMTDDMDVNCGVIVDGDGTVESVGEEIFEAILAVASGRQTKSEELGIGRHELIFWNIGGLL